MKSIIEKINKSARYVEEENKRFDYIASKGEVAVNVWHSYLDTEDRCAISKHIDAASRKGFEQVRVCYDFVKSYI